MITHARKGVVACKNQGEYLCHCGGMLVQLKKIIKKSVFCPISVSIAYLLRGTENTRGVRVCV